MRWQLEEIRKIDFRNSVQNIVIVGGCATGKTALAARIAKEAIANGTTAVYSTEENLQLLYKTVMFLFETRSFIFVTNRQLSEWDNMGVDKHTASTFRQRIMVGAQLIYLG